MQAIIEAPSPSATLQFYVRGPRPDINDEWGSTSSRHRGGGGNGGGNNGDWSSSGGGVDKRSTGGSGGRSVMSSVDADGVAEDRPSGSSGAQYYTLPWPSGWKLERGRVSKFLRALQAPIMLVGGVGRGGVGWGGVWWAH